MEVRKIGNEWIADRILDFESPFNVVLLSADYASSRQCDGNNAVTSRPEIGYPCIRIINNGRFEWSWKKLHWGGTGWGDSWANNIDLPPGGSVDYSYWLTWDEFDDRDLGWDDEKDMQIFLVSIPQ